MRSVLNKVCLIIIDVLTKDLCIGAYLFPRAVSQIGQKSGWLYLSLYLKQCTTYLHEYCRGEKSPHSLLLVLLSLTRSGYLRIIPSFHQQLMYKKDGKADQLVKIYLSFFSLAKVIQLAKRIDKLLFSSIVSPWDDPERNDMGSNLEGLSHSWACKSNVDLVSQEINGSGSCLIHFPITSL
ncbi:hypothetical protein QQP08_005511 [Theobroma cacao]|nr:hypothetical protein QQP08_005511 [Theobroma cacao]